MRAGSANHFFAGRNIEPRGDLDSPGLQIPLEVDRSHAGNALRQDARVSPKLFPACGVIPVSEYHMR
jgi:hypothetical protein